MSCATSSSRRAHSARLLACLLPLLLPVPLRALPEDADQPINIQADTGRINQQQSRATYEGNVRLDQGSLRVTADRMVVEYRNRKVVSITFTGTPARYGQELERDGGRVRATADEITYYTRNERLFLTGNAFLEQQGNQLRGNEIRYDIVAGRIDAESRADERINMVLLPDREPGVKPSANNAAEAERGTKGP